MIASQVATALINVALHEQVAEAAIRDPLTGLWNRRQLDVGSFNKLHGHGIGDSVLRAFGAILVQRFRASDLVARYGGEEFVAVLDGATIEEAGRIADGIRRELESVRFPGADGAVLTATVSAGCASLGPDVASFDSMIELADVGLQMAKRGGRNQVVAA